MHSTMTPQAKREALQRVPRFAGCDDGQLVALSESAEERVLAPGSVVQARPDSPVTYVVLSGEAAVDSELDNGRTIGPGSVIGRLADDETLGAVAVRAITLMHVLALETASDSGATPR